MPPGSGGDATAIENAINELMTRLEYLENKVEAQAIEIFNLTTRITQLEYKD